MILVDDEKKEAQLSLSSLSGADKENRTPNLIITSDVLCQLSYIS